MEYFKLLSRIIQACWPKAHKKDRLWGMSIKGGRREYCISPGSPASYTDLNGTTFPNPLHPVKLERCHFEHNAFHTIKDTSKLNSALSAWFSLLSFITRKIPFCLANSSCLYITICILHHIEFLICRRWRLSAAHNTDREGDVWWLPNPPQSQSKTNVMCYNPECHNSAWTEDKAWRQKKTFCQLPPAYARETFSCYGREVTG